MARGLGGGAVVKPIAEFGEEGAIRTVLNGVSEGRAAALADDDGVVEVHIADEGEFVFHASTLDWRETNLADEGSAVGVFFLDVVHFGAHGGDDVGGRGEDGIDHFAVDGGDFLPGGVGIGGFLAAGGVVGEVQRTAFAFPSVGEAVDEDDGVAGAFGCVDGVGVGFGAEAGELQHVKAEVVGIEAGRAVFGIDHGDFAVVGQSGGGDQGGVGFAGTAGTVNRDAGFDLLFGCFLEGKIGPWSPCFRLG